MQSVSRKMVINRNIDILIAQDLQDMYKYKKPAAVIKDLKWNGTRK